MSKHPMRGPRLPATTTANFVHAASPPTCLFSRGLARSRPYPREPAQEPQLGDGRTGDVGAW